MPSLDRRSFLVATGVSTLPLAASQASPAIPVAAISDSGWRLIVDDKAVWKDDAIFLPADVDLKTLPVNPPTGGWKTLSAGGVEVTLPATVEQHLWGKYGSRPYTSDEYRYADDDPVPQNGAYVGVSWWVKDLDIPAAAKGRCAILTVRGARLRAEVYLNEKLVGYSVVSELPVVCDITKAMRPGARNRLAIRITNPGGRYDWKDSGTISWGAVKLYPGHGFGGLDRGLTLSFHPLEARIADAFVLNTPEPRIAHGFMDILPATVPSSAAGLRAKASATLTDAKTGAPVKAAITVEAVEIKDGHVRAKLKIEAPEAELWDIENPNLYRLTFAWTEKPGVTDTRAVRFGFRWFAPDGIGKDAVLRLNGLRTKIYSAISWGYWGLTGLWPTPELAAREVDCAKALGLNCLHFHRNLGRHDVLDLQDEKGLLRVMEPGSGRTAIAPKTPMKPADKFARDYLVARIVGMVKAFRSHPSLVQYTLQNEISGDLSNPDLEAVLRTIHDLDPSRTVILCDGFVARGSAQGVFLPYDDRFHASDKEPAGGWWVNHQGAGDQWYDKFYAGKDDFIHRNPDKTVIVEFGEMEGCAVADNHLLDTAEILARGGKSYDLDDHKAIIAGTNDFLSRAGFRAAFPTAEALYLSVGKKSYDSWQNYLENIRIGDSTDMACISGWESTAIENHSGIVSAMRNFRADPELLRSSLLPVRPVAKQRKLVFALGEKAELDLWLLNNTNRAVSGTLTLSVIGPDGAKTAVGSYPTPAMVPDRFSYLLAEKVATPAFTAEGPHKIVFALPGVPVFSRDIWVTDPNAALKRPLTIAVSGIAKSLRTRLDAISGLRIEDFKAGRSYDGIIASGLKAEEIERRQIGEQTGLEKRPAKGEKKPAPVLGELPPDVLQAVQAGTPLIALVPEDGLAEGVAKQLAGLGLFAYAGQVGDLRAPWMGNWNLLRAHALHAGIPADMATGVLHQIQGQLSNGLLVEGDGLEVVAGYSRDHDRHTGAASFIAAKGKMRVLFHRLPDMAGALQDRWYRNALNWL